MVEIVKTEGVLGGKARLDGRRIAVFDIAERVLDHGRGRLASFVIHNYLRNLDY